MNRITIELTEDQIYELVGVMEERVENLEYTATEAAKSREQRQKEGHGYLGDRYDAKEVAAHAAYNQRILTKLSQALVTEQAKTL